MPTFAYTSFSQKKKIKKKSRSGRKIGAVGDDKQLIFFTRPNRQPTVLGLKSIRVFLSHAGRIKLERGRHRMHSKADGLLHKHEDSNDLDWRYLQVLKH